MLKNPIKSQAQARTAGKYLEVLEEEVMDEKITLEEMQIKHHQMYDIIVALEVFHQHNSIRLVVDNTHDEEEVTEC